MMTRYTVRLRDWRAEDASQYLDFYKNDPLSAFSGGPMEPPVAWRHLASVIGHWTLRGFGVWAVEDLKTGQLCGCAGAWCPQDWPQMEFVFWFTTEAFANGLAAQGAALAFDAVTQAYGAAELVTFVHAEHGDAQRIIEDLGGQRESGIRELGGDPHFIYRYGADGGQSQRTM